MVGPIAIAAVVLSVLSDEQDVPSLAELFGDLQALLTDDNIAGFARIAAHKLVVGHALIHRAHQDPKNRVVSIDVYGPNSRAGNVGVHIDGSLQPQYLEPGNKTAHYESLFRVGLVASEGPRSHRPRFVPNQVTHTHSYELAPGESLDGLQDELLEDAENDIFKILSKKLDRQAEKLTPKENV